MKPFLIMCVHCLQELELDIMSKVVVLLCSLEREIQNLCVSALLNLTTNKPEKYEFVFVNSYHNVVVTDVYCFVRTFWTIDCQQLLELRSSSFVTPDGWIQPLLLINHFSLDNTAKRYN